MEELFRRGLEWECSLLSVDYLTRLSRDFLVSIQFNLNQIVEISNRSFRKFRTNSFVDKYRIYQILP